MLHCVEKTKTNKNTEKKHSMWKHLKFTETGVQTLSAAAVDIPNGYQCVLAVPLPVSSLLTCLGRLHNLAQESGPTLNRGELQEASGSWLQTSYLASKSVARSFYSTVLEYIHFFLKVKTVNLLDVPSCSSVYILQFTRGSWNIYIPLFTDSAVYVRVHVQVNKHLWSYFPT